MRKPDARSETAGDGGHVIRCICAQRARTQREAIRGGVHHSEDLCDIGFSRDNARQAEDRARRIIRVDAETHAELLGRGHNGFQEAADIRAQLGGADALVAVEHAA